MIDKSEPSSRDVFSDVGIACTPMGSDFFRASGDDAVKIQAAIINHNNRMWMIRTIAPYAAAVAFAAIAAFLIVFAPESRSTAANIVAAALLLLAVGIAGFTRFSAQLPGMKIDAGKGSR